ncbi:hypothetical protein AKJ57_02550 [candidate division MSBL1 archaeon SCGC-AAA259A05]|uniref:Uncharacterized protein n=1 Tax=candidate division MSBL1 archaeon SCGC-AAA259A05 TaxID=1698259 RepID=A0A133UA53_9EURY|nr:hypothetical protein AKJ57_02550 [candidate division MSBL1 archaeon SCGC-AAA259A05]
MLQLTKETSSKLITNNSRLVKMAKANGVDDALSLSFPSGFFVKPEVPSVHVASLFLPVTSLPSCTYSIEPKKKADPGSSTDWWRKRSGRCREVKTPKINPICASSVAGRSQRVRASARVVAESSSTCHVVGEMCSTPSGSQTAIRIHG